jgi:predicted DNA-binding protein
MKEKTIILRVEPELKQDLQKLADNDSRSLSDFIRLQLKKLVASLKKKS